MHSSIRSISHLFINSLFHVLFLHSWPIIHSRFPSSLSFILSFSTFIPSFPSLKKKVNWSNTIHFTGVINCCHLCPIRIVETWNPEMPVQSQEIFLTKLEARCWRPAWTWVSTLGSYSSYYFSHCWFWISEYKVHSKCWRCLWLVSEFISYLRHISIALLAAESSQFQNRVD